MVACAYALHRDLPPAVCAALHTKTGSIIDHKELTASHFFTLQGSKDGVVLKIREVFLGSSSTFTWSSTFQEGKLIRSTTEFSHPPAGFPVGEQTTEVSEEKRKSVTDSMVQDILRALRNFNI